MTLGWTLLHFLWEGLAIAVVLAAALWAIDLRAARVRYALASLALLLMTLAPLATYGWLARPWVEESVVLTTVTTIDSPDQPGAVPAAAPPWIAWLPMVWATGVALFSTRLLLAAWNVRQLRRRDCRPMEIGADLVRRMGLTRAVEFVESSRVAVPAQIGALKPLVLVPVGMLTQLPAAQVEALLLHELAHIRRHDYLINLLQTVVETLLFYHPAVWWVSGVMRRERENCCDDLVVNVTGDRHGYASALLTLAESRGVMMPAAAATGGDLKRRIERMLAPRPRANAFLPLLLLALLGFGALYAQSNSKPGDPSATELAALKREVAELKATLQKVISTPMANPAGLKALEEEVARLRAELTGSAREQERRAVELEREQQIKSERDLKRQAANYQEVYDRPPANDEGRAYRLWRYQDVAYIIAPEEAQAFDRLKTNEEREKFIEQFWQRRGMAAKEEHYRRIAYANERFAAPNPLNGGVTAGWRTDKGRIYILYGPPDELEEYSGRGSAWRYRGTGLIVRFDAEGRMVPGTGK